MKTIVWAMDYMGMTPALLKNVTGTLKIFSASEGVTIQPVSVVAESPTLGQLPGYFIDQVRENLVKTCNASGLPQLLPPKLIFCKESSQRKSVEKLVEFAKKGGFDAIVVASVSRRGLSRWILGSFTESLIMHSSVPVVVVNPKVKPSPKVDHILFPMGTSSKVKPLFRRVLKLAKELNSKVTILAQVEFPIQPMAQYKDFVGPQGMASLGTFVKGERKRLLAEGNILKSLAESSGVKAAVEVGDSVTPIADKILSFAQAKNVGLIAMGNASGPIGSVLLGSVSREVVRRSEVPVWILHHSTTKKKKKK